MEDLMDPDNGFGGDFSFSRKAWILEQAGLFWHAAFRRELAGRYAIDVCSRYYAAIADELERVFVDPVRAELYRQKSVWWRRRGLDELHLCNGDRILARLKGNDKLKRLSHNEVIAILDRGLRDESVDARQVAVHLLLDMGALEALEQAMQDNDVEIRKAAAAAFADRMYLPGLALALEDKDSTVSAIAREVLEVKPESVGPYLRTIHFLAEGLRNGQTRTFAVEQLQRVSGLMLKEGEEALDEWVQQTMQGMRPGALVECFNETSQMQPVTAKVFQTVDIGMKFQANFPKVWYNDEYWHKPEIFPEDAKGPFRLQITAKLYIPADGNYRFYVKTDAPNRAVVTIGTPEGQEREIISPQNDEKLQYVLQVGMQTHRIDFSEAMPLKKGLVKLGIIYSGKEARKIHDEHMVRISGVQKAGIQLYWSSDHHLTEFIPAANLFH
jgi:hypothetical protein